MNRNEKTEEKRNVAQEEVTEKETADTQAAVEDVAAQTETEACEDDGAAAIRAELEKAAAEKAAAETAAAKDSLLRLTAEYDNYRKRTVKEKEAIYTDAYAAAVTAFLPMIDNLERAVACPEGEGLKKGLDQVLKQLAGILEHEKITVIDPALKPFDPELHNAVMHIEDDHYDENTVAEVLLKGYKIKDKVIRHAMVKVAN